MCRGIWFRLYPFQTGLPLQTSLISHGSSPSTLTTVGDPSTQCVQPSMSDEDPNILTGENPSSTPLDLLLNAISGSDRQYTYNGQDGLATDVDLAFLTEDVSNEAAAVSISDGELCRD